MRTALAVAAGTLAAGCISALVERLWFRYKHAQLIAEIDQDFIDLNHGTYAGFMDADGGWHVLTGGKVD
jgi:hypothetical protein